MVRYYPVCKWKKGEQHALRGLTPVQQSKLVPIIEIVDEISAEDMILTLENINCPVYVDTDNIDSDEKETQLAILSAGVQTGTTIHAVLSYPFTSFDSLDPVLYDNCLFKIPIFCDLEEADHNQIIESIQKKKGPHFGILLEIGLSDKQEYLGIQLAATREFLRDHSEFLLSADVVVFSTSSFPEDFSCLGSGQVRSFPRNDIRLLASLLPHLPGELMVKAAYSDYGVSRFTDTDIDFSKMKYGILPKIKYTTDDAYYVFKGQRDHRTGEMVINAKSLAQWLVSSEFFFGRNFSYGDNEIYNKSLPETRPGGNTNWVTYCANHHFVALLNQISMLFDS
jgi:hypothetical protein